MNALHTQLLEFQNSLTEEQEKKMAKTLIELTKLKKSKEHSDRYVLGAGHMDKTDLGVIRSIFHQMIESLK